MNTLIIIFSVVVILLLVLRVRYVLHRKREAKRKLARQLGLYNYDELGI